jgi:peptide/nickel transport system ATP-binding protein
MSAAWATPPISPAPSAALTTNTALASVRDLSVRFRSPRGEVQAVNGVSFDVQPGEVLGLIGESGCGKSVTLRALMRLLPTQRTHITGGITVDGLDVMAMDERALSAYRGGTASMIFQDPGLALDPVYTIGQQIGEAIVRHTGCSKAQAREQAQHWLEQVKVPSARARLDNYPHELSGGMRQRAMIALALSCKPKLVLADEPTTALDATVQMQVLLILRELQQSLGMGAVFVTHDLGVAAEICDRIAVMYAGRMVELGRAEDVLLRPQHPYTQALLASTLHGSMRGTRRAGLPGAPPDLVALPAGCAFAERCAHADAACLQAVPQLLARPGASAAACWRLDPVPDLAPAPALPETSA